MSDTPAGPVGREQMRASDADRHTTAERLQRAVSEGRLTLEEFSSRTSAAYAAVTLGDLTKLTLDLPDGLAPRPAESSALQPHTPHMPSAPTEPYRGRRKFTSIMGDSTERLHGVLPRNLKTVCVMGDLVLDLRDTAIDGDVVIKGTVVMGDMRIIVPDHVTVINEGAQIMGSAKIRVHSAPSGPTVRLAVTTVMGDLRVSDATHYKERRRAPWHRWSGDD